MAETEVVKGGSLRTSFNQVYRKKSSGGGGWHTQVNGGRGAKVAGRRDAQIGQARRASHPPPSAQPRAQPRAAGGARGISGRASGRGGVRVPR